MRSNPTVIALAIFLLAAGAFAQSPPAASDPNADEWHLTTTVYGNELHERMNLKIEKGKVSGWILERGKRTPLSGTSDAGGVRFETRDGEGRTVYTGRLEGEELAGTAVSTGPEEWGETPPSPWRARKAPEKSHPASPRTIDFEPAEFHRTFSASIPPALRIWPGDVSGRRRSTPPAWTRR